VVIVDPPRKALQIQVTF